jgi:hypothetical protein
MEGGHGRTSSSMAGYREARQRGKGGRGEEHGVRRGNLWRRRKGGMEEVAARGGDSVLLWLLKLPVRELQELSREEEGRGKREERRKGREKRKGRKNVEIFPYLKIFGRKK